MGNAIKRTSILMGILLAITAAAFGQQSRYSYPPLARTAAEMTFRVLAQRLPGLHKAGPPRRRLASSIRGLHAFPVAA